MAAGVWRLNAALIHAGAPGAFREGANNPAARKPRLVSAVIRASMGPVSPLVR
jgi:hypothetical protein